MECFETGKWIVIVGYFSFPVFFVVKKEAAGFQPADAFASVTSNCGQPCVVGLLGSGMAPHNCSDTLLVVIADAKKGTFSIVFGTPLAGWVDFKGFWLD